MIESNIAWTAIGRDGEPVDLQTGAEPARRALGVGFARGDRVELASPSTPRRARKPDHEGRITALRSPLPPPPDPPLSWTEFDDLPPEPEAPAGLAWAGIVPSALTGAIAALLFSPVFALLAGASVLVLIGRWLSGRVSHRRGRRRRSEAIEQARAEFEITRARWIDTERERRRSAVLSPMDLARQVGEQRTPWHERLDPAAELEVVAGLGSVSLSLPDTIAGDDLGALGVACDTTVAGIPVAVRLTEGRGLALTGDRADAMSSARWIVGSLASRYGPADLTVLLLTTADRLVDWEWTKWLPSLDAVAVDRDETDTALAPLVASDTRGPSGVAGAPVLVVVDGIEPTGPGPLARLVSGRCSSSRFVWIGDVAGVPAGCSHRLHGTADRHGELADLGAPDSVVRLNHRWQLSSVEADAVARWLAPFTDPEREEVGAGLPASVSLATAAGITGDLEPAIRKAWQAADPTRLMVPLGADRNGPVEFDLVTAGPHALVAGTTGSGKSELLRSLVAGAAMRQPPDLLEFVLFDFKGGGAFDLVAGLPHVSAVVTDLDPHEARRAIQGLQAEVVEREERLRSMGVSDIADTGRGRDERFPRLVVIVDEFASLADGLPDVLHSLVDIARRGRSLGVHLILATQRPAGIVTGQIRANTNLRLCLRVQDRADSLDVIDCSDAADLPAVPGRVVARLEAGPVRHFQVAPVIHGPLDSLVQPFVLHHSQLDARRESDRVRAASAEIETLISKAGDADSTVGPRRDENPIDLILAATNTLAVSAGQRRPAAPWLQPLAAVGWSDVVAAAEAAPHASTAVPLGLLDDPVARRRVVAAWNPMADGLLVLGADGAEREATVGSVLASMLESALVTGTELPWTYVFDGGSADLTSALSVLPNVVDVISVREPERLARAVETFAGGGPESVRGDVLLVVHGWAEISDALDEFGGPDSVAALGRLARRSGPNAVRIIVTASSERDLPSRITSQLAVRMLHRPSDTASFLSFGLRPKDVPSLVGDRFVDPTTGLVGRVLRFGRSEIADLADRASSACGQVRPDRIRVLGACVDRADLPAAHADENGWVVPVGLDTNLAPQRVHVRSRRPVVVLGQPGTGRSTALRTICASLPDSVQVVVLDDAELLDAEEAARQLEAAANDDAALIIACTPAAARSFAGWIAPLLSNATVLLLNPTRADGELLRVLVPDLSREPVGRAALVERGRVSVLQVAA